MVLYKQAMALILRHIEENGLTPGERLPNEPQMAASTGVSMVTIRRALAELAARGIVRREQGRGTFVGRSRVQAQTTRPGSLRNGLSLDARSVLRTELLGVVSRPAEREEAERLNLTPAAPVWEIRRLRLLSGRPMICETSVIPLILAPNVGDVLKADPSTSLYDVLSRDHGLEEAREEQTLVCRPPERPEQVILSLPAQGWIVEISGVSYARNQTPIDCFKMLFDASGFAFNFGGFEGATEAIEIDRGADGHPTSGDRAASIGKLPR
jgi:GntR family transcriptional regulator